MTEKITREQIEQCRWLLKALTQDAANPKTGTFTMKQPEWENRVDALFTLALQALDMEPRPQFKEGFDAGVKKAAEAHGNWIRALSAVAKIEPVAQEAGAGRPLPFPKTWDELAALLSDIADKLPSPPLTSLPEPRR